MQGPNRRSNALTSRTEKEKLEKKIKYSVLLITKRISKRGSVLKEGAIATITSD